MNNQASFSSKDKSEKLKCRLPQFLFGALRVDTKTLMDGQINCTVTPFKDFINIRKHKIYLLQNKNVIVI